MPRDFVAHAVTVTLCADRKVLKHDSRRNMFNSLVDTITTDGLVPLGVKHLGTRGTIQ